MITLFRVVNRKYACFICKLFVFFLRRTCLLRAVPGHFHPLMLELQSGFLREAFVFLLQPYFTDLICLQLLFIHQRLIQQDVLPVLPDGPLDLSLPLRCLVCRKALSFIRNPGFILSPQALQPFRCMPRIPATQQSAERIRHSQAIHCQH